jgi:hypothetical protein
MKGKKVTPLKNTFLAALSVFTCYCSNQLPLLQRETPNVITCKINGRPWIADAASSENNLRLVFYRDNSLHLHARALANNPENKVTSTISLFIASVDAPGIYYLGSNPKNTGDYTDFETPPYAFYFTDQSSTGFVHITKMDQAKRSIAGTFAYQASVPGHSAHSVQISDGKFNLTY